MSITILVDGREIVANEGAMLVDAAKAGDVEIPVFCYEPKLGDPVGACRMCLVEIEGIPKLQTACSTPVRDGMVVYTMTERVKEAQNAVVEFLLVNHPLDCPVCDKGGECPLQDIAMGWGEGKSRVTDPKRHFAKPIPLSPLVRIDRERCILCYRCVRFSQEVAEDAQLQLLDRGADTYVGTFDDRPYIAPFHGNIIELCPVGALTSETYRFRARPWDIEDAGSVCTTCPGQCNVKFTVRDEKVVRVLGRDNHDVDDGWLCDRGRFGFESFNDPERITAPMKRVGGNLVEITWKEALDTAAAALAKAGASTALVAGGQTSNEEGFILQRIMREALGSANLTSRPGGDLDRGQLVALSNPAIGASVADIDSADSVLVIGADPFNQMAALDLRIRKNVRRRGMRLVIASDRPTALDPIATDTIGFAPGEDAAAIRALAQDGHAALTAGKTIVIWSERLGHGAAGTGAITDLLDLIAALDATHLEVPEAANARGLREVGVYAGTGPGLSEAEAGKDAPAIRAALQAGEVRAAILANTNPVRDFPRGDEWNAGLAEADFVLAISAFDDESTKHATIVLPAETHAEKDGTVTHIDGRLQRLRPTVPHPGNTEAGWHALVELSARLGVETDIHSASDALAQITAAVPFYAGLTPDSIGGQGVRWQNRDDAAAFGASTAGANGAVTVQRATPSETPAAASTTDAGTLVLGTYRPLWAGDSTEHNESLEFLAPHQTAEISPADAAELGFASGDRVEVSVADSKHTVIATVRVRGQVRPGTVFLLEGLAADNANVLPAGSAVTLTKARARAGAVA